MSGPYQSGGGFMGQVDHARLDTSLVPRREQFDLFRSGLGVLHDVEPGTGAGRGGTTESGFAARLDSWLIGGMFVTAGHQGASRVLRSATRARRDGFEHITLMHVRSGRVVGDVGGEIDCGPGDTIVTDASRPLAVNCSDTRNIGVRLSRAALTEAGVDLGPSGGALHGTILRGAAGRLVGDHFALLARRASMLEAEDAPLVERATASLVRDCLRWQRGRGPEASASDRARVERFVEERLAMGPLDVAAIARGTGLSRSALFRSFPGGVERFVTALRLDRAMAMLRDGREAGGVAQVGHAVGYADPAQFGRAFRRRFGATPGEVRRDLVTAARSDLPQTYRRWFSAVHAPGTQGPKSGTLGG